MFKKIGIIMISLIVAVTSFAGIAMANEIDTADAVQKTELEITEFIESDESTEEDKQLSEAVLDNQEKNWILANEEMEQIADFQEPLTLQEESSVNDDDLVVLESDTDDFAVLSESPDAEPPVVEPEETESSKNQANSDQEAAVTVKKPTGLSCVQKKKGAYATLSWKEVAGADGYVVYRKCVNTVQSFENFTENTTKNSWTKVKTLKHNVFRDKKAEKGVLYYYSVKAYKVVNGKTYYSARSAKVKGIVLQTPQIDFTACSDGFLLKWSGTQIEPTKVYSEIYRSTKKNGKYKLLKRVSAAKQKTTGYGTSVLYFNGGRYLYNSDLGRYTLAKNVKHNINGWAVADKTVPYGKYYYKVRTYVLLNGHKVYSSFSKPVKPTLANKKGFKKSLIRYRDTDFKGGKAGSFFGIDWDADWYLHCGEQYNGNVKQINKGFLKTGYPDYGY